MERQELIKRFAEVQHISESEAETLISGETVEDIMKNIKAFNLKKIYEKLPPLNREQKRKLLKQLGAKGKEDINTVSNTATKLNYINMIQKLRKLNEQQSKENENGNTIKDN